MSLPLKAPLLAVGAIATAGAGVLVVKGFSSSKEEVSISSLLVKDISKRTIAVGEVEDWKKVWEEYKKSSKDIGNLGNAVDVPESFKNTCKSKLESKVSGKDSDDYKNFISYCVRDTLISDLLKDANETILLKTEGAETEGWKKAGDRYREANNKGQTKDVWGISDFEKNKGTSGQNAPDDFRNKCETNLGSKDISNTTLFDQVKKWCTKPKGQG